MTIVEQIMQLAARPCGVCSTDIPGMKPDYLLSRCAELVRNGRLFKSGNTQGKRRYFVNLSAAQAYDAEQMKQTNATIAKMGSRANWSKNAKVVINKDTKITICPPWQPRFQAIDMPHIHTANQRGRVMA